MHQQKTWKTRRRLGESCAWSGDSLADLRPAPTAPPSLPTFPPSPRPKTHHYSHSHGRQITVVVVQHPSSVTAAQERPSAGASRACSLSEAHHSSRSIQQNASTAAAEPSRSSIRSPRADAQCGKRGTRRIRVRGIVVPRRQRTGRGVQVGACRRRFRGSVIPSGHRGRIYRPLLFGCRHGVDTVGIHARGSNAIRSHR